MKMEKKFLRIYAAHGVEFTGQTGGGEEMYGTCPFTGKENKFYVNLKSGLWSSKTAGLGGNIAKFLELRSADYRSQMIKRDWRRLAENRQLPIEAFREWEFGIDDQGPGRGRYPSYTLPIRNIDKSMINIRLFSLGNRMLRNTAGAEVGLFGAPAIRERPNEPIYLCEGEWDAIALRWLLRTMNEPGVVVAVPGAGIFKRQWIPWFQGRIVHTLYDADGAGREGELLIAKRLTGVARKITYVHWPNEVPTGFDTRDWVIYGMVVRDTPEICLEKLLRRFYDKPKDDLSAAQTQQVITKRGKFTIVRKIRIKRPSRWKTPPTIEDVHQVFNKWLYLPNNDAIDVMLATCLTSRMEGPPIWLFFVGPPGSTKTVYLTSLMGMHLCEFVSSLTTHSLISGMGIGTDNDPSLIPKLDQRVLVVKDFTTILSQSDHDQREIFGTLRDAFDGQCSKTFGSGVRSYKSRFSVIAACTPAIYSLGEQQQALGERFLKFAVADNLHHKAEGETIMRAIDNSDKEIRVQEELHDVVKSFIERTCADYQPSRLTEKMKSKVKALAMFGARLRGVVPRDKFQRDVEITRPSAEVGTRLGQQLAKIARGLATIRGRKHPGPSEYALVKKIALDTISQKSEDVLRAMIRVMGGTEHLTPMSMRELATKTGYSFATIQRVMSDLHALEIIKRQGAGAKSTWTLSDYIYNLIKDAGLYTVDELKRPPKIRIRVKRQWKREPKPHPRMIRSFKGTPPVSITTQGGKITISTTSAASPKPDGKP